MFAGNLQKFSHVIIKTKNIYILIWIFAPFFKKLAFYFLQTLGFGGSLGFSKNVLDLIFTQNVARNLKTQI